ncbi:hypothetical protein QR685DRAFT_597475 [Neurospora intermedia]|uniref:SWIM-type domain-containing protein n=1 Tax=Neurospora intermedia TaxID=5142 RepID=A0ABR3DGE3_NEUIN
MASHDKHHHGHPDPNPNLLHPPGPVSPLQPQEEAKSSSPPSHSPPTSTTPALLHLPTSRQFLTSLITAISNIPLLDDEPPTQIHKPAPAPGPGSKPQSKAKAADVPPATEETETAIRRKRLLQILKEEGDERKEAKDDVIIGKKNKIKIPAGGQVNPLKLVPPEYRHLIITLHVLFPGVVLPGLEVLERGLVERVVLRSASSGGNTSASGGSGAGSGDNQKEYGAQTMGEVKKEEEEEEEEHSSGRGNEGGGQENEEDLDVIMGEDGGEDDDGDFNSNQKANLNGSHHHPKPIQHTPSFYLVRSSQFLNVHHPKRKRKYPSSNLSGLYGDAVDTEGTPWGVGGGEVDRERDYRIQRYMVSLEAWNCTCAAFAFACVSEPDAGDDAKETGGGEELQERKRERDNKGSAGWTFGGMTLFNARDHSSVPPVCKHLLACLLADKWTRALGRYVTERMVSREEMAGIVANV